MTKVYLAATEGRGRRATRSLHERFLEKVDREGPIHEVLGTACWVWLGTRTSRGYGHISVGSRKERRTIYAHRYALESALGRDLEVSECALHRCDNPWCVNPEHLLAGSQADNMRDMRSKGRARKVRGSEHPKAKLTLAIVQELRTRRAGGTTIAELATELGMSQSAVSQAVRGETWRSA